MSKSITTTTEKTVPVITMEFNPEALGYTIVHPFGQCFVLAENIVSTEIDRLGRMTLTYRA